LFGHQEININDKRSNSAERRLWKTQFRRKSQKFGQKYPFCKIF
jgi:hypothetical protein